jgi:recombination protein RecT
MPETTQDVVPLSASQKLAVSVRHPNFLEQVAAALPEHVPVARFTRAAVTLALTNETIAGCDERSILTALIRCAQDGLMPDGREAAIVPYKGKATYQPMIGGIRRTLADHGWSLRTVVVYANDEFEYDEGLDPHLHHRRPRPGVDRGEMVAAYAVARHQRFPTEVAVMYEDEIGKARAKAQTQAVWNEWPERMWEKTVGKYLAKRLPLADLDERTQRILAADDTPPAQAATLIYGPQRAAIEASSTRVEAAPAEPADAEREAADEAVTPTRGDDPASPTSAADPNPAGVDFSDEPVPDPVDFQPPDPATVARAQEAAAAGEVLVPSGVHAQQGRSIRQVAELGAEGEKWLLWCLKKWSRDTFRAAVEIYVAVLLPDVWERYQEWLAENEGEAA